MNDPFYRVYQRGAFTRGVPCPENRRIFDKIGNRIRTVRSSDESSRTVTDLITVKSKLVYCCFIDG